MTTYLSADFVERRVTVIPPAAVPDGWGVDRAGNYCQLDLKMCQISALHFDFQWGRERQPAPRLASVLDAPSRIVRLDISLNDLTFLHHEWLAPFRNLRALDASINQIKHFQGIEILQNLAQFEPFPQRLAEQLRLSMNELRDISAMPSLINLRILDVSNNKLESLDGLSSLPKLEELYAHRNELRDILPVMSCGQLRVLNAANNHITSLDTTLKVLSNLRFLQVLSLHSNPLDREPHYQGDILRVVNIMTLDNVSVKPLPRREEDHQRHADNMFSLKDAARQAFQDRMRVAKERLDENVSFLQRRIVGLQHEYEDFQAKLKADLEACLRYLDSLSADELGSADRSAIGAVLGGKPYEHPWQAAEPQGAARAPRQHADYSKIKETDEVLRCAYNELIKQKGPADVP
ncbi:hypothetical protein BaRGS_00012932 [Batillaria attramentaria]|uniref:Uncharacterized protein n=1 Tax=Batillaria attramentaria TaxID=370345 RepID=A0ABD0L9Y1_9CAEN